jgi:hypothetical protein
MCYATFWTLLYKITLRAILNFPPDNLVFLVILLPKNGGIVGDLDSDFMHEQEIIICFRENPRVGDLVAFEIQFYSKGYFKKQNNWPKKSSK